MTAAKLPACVELVRCCRYCQREMGESAEAYRENPFCRLCLNERIAAASAAQGPTELHFVGEYAMVIPTLQTLSSGGRQRPVA
jgi:hypothetical protein